MNRLFKIVGCAFFALAHQSVRAEGDQAVRDEIRKAADDSAFVWSSGRCRWVEKHYAGLSLDFMKVVEEGKFANQLPFPRDPAGPSLSPYEDILTYLDRFLSPSYSEVREVSFNSEGWKLESYADTFRLSPKPSQVTYVNPKLPIQGRKTIIQFGDKQWSRGPLASAFETEQGVQSNIGKKIPLALADLFPMLFVENIFLDVPGRTVVVTKKQDGSYELSVSQNEGVTILGLKKSKGVLVTPDQKTTVSGKLMKLGGEFGEVKVTGNQAAKDTAVPRFTVDITLVENGGKVNVITREVLEYACEEVSSESLMAPIAEARK